MGQTTFNKFNTERISLLHVCKEGPLYRALVGPYCITCHVWLTMCGVPTSHYTNFIQSGIKTSFFYLSKMTLTFKEKFSTFFYIKVMKLLVKFKQEFF